LGGRDRWISEFEASMVSRKLKIMENEKHPLDDLKNDEITKKREK
jgi:hypothetical protein